MTVSTEDSRIGEEATLLVNLHDGTLEIPVSIKDQRPAYGRWDYQVVPLLGRGKVWVRETSLLLLPRHKEEI